MARDPAVPDADASTGSRRGRVDRRAARRRVGVPYGDRAAAGDSGGRVPGRRGARAAGPGCPAGVREGVAGCRACGCWGSGAPTASGPPLATAPSGAPGPLGLPGPLGPLRLPGPLRFPCLVMVPGVRPRRRGASGAPRAGSLRPVSRWAEGRGGRRGLQVLQLDAGCREDHVPGDVNGVPLPRVQGADLVFVHDQRAVVSGVRFTVHQSPGLVVGTGREDRVREGDHADAGLGGIGGEAQESGQGDEERGGGSGESVGADVALGGVSAGRVRADPGDAFQGRSPDLPARGVEFETDRPAQLVQGEVDGAEVVTRGGCGLGDVAPAGGPGRSGNVLRPGRCGRGDRGANTCRGAWGPSGSSGCAEAVTSGR